MTAPVLKVGQNVKTNTTTPYQGTLRFIGTIEGTVGNFCGIELPEAIGKNDGTVKGKRYFDCAPNHGVFVKKDLVVPVATSSTVSKRTSTIGSSTVTTKPTTNGRPAATSTVSKRASIAPAVRSTAARQSVSSTPTARRTPTTSRPSSQVVPRDSVPPKLNRSSTQSIPREASPVKQHVRETQVDTGAEDEESEDNQQEEDDDEEEQNENKEPLTETDPPAPSNMGPPPTIRKPVVDQQQAAAAKEALRENEQLKVKLRAMEKKRMEDRDTIKRIDTFESENERLKTVITNLTGKMRKLNEDKQTAEARVRELEQEKQAEPERPAQFESELELATLDKEMAEERVDALEHELGELKAKYEELELETDILREENKELTSSMTDEEKAGTGWIHLERERDRLREALILLRDHKQETELDMKEEIETLRNDLSESEETVAKYLETAEQLQRAEDTNQHLKEQLEAAENQEDLIATMMQERDRHLAQIEDLRATLSELEELAQTNEDLERLYVDNEKGLLNKLDEQEAMLVEHEREETEKDRVIEDLEFTLNKFRSVMQGLQGDIDEARRSREISEIQAIEMNSKSRAMMELNIKLQSNAAKSQMKTIDFEMLKAQAALSKSHVDMLSLFLPETFDSERLPIQTLLTFGRLKKKASLVANMLSERLRDRGQLDSGEETLAGYKIVRSMQWISLTTDRFEQFMSRCSPAEYAAFSNIGQEIEPVERAVTNWLEALRSDELRADSSEQMQRMESILADVAEKLLPTTPDTKIAHLAVQAMTIANYTELSAALFDWLAKVVKLKLGDASDDDTPSIDFDRKLEQLSRLARSVRNASGKVTSELEKKRNKNLCLDETGWPLFASTEQDASSVNDRVHQLCLIVLGHLNEFEQAEKLSYSTLLDLLSDSGDDVLAALLTDLKDLYEHVQMLEVKAGDSNTSLNVEVKPAPWIVRAKDLKAQRQISVETQEELAQSARKNQELVVRIAEKERLIEEVMIRAELAEKRVKENKSKEGQEKALRDELEQLKMTRDNLELQLSDLTAELSALQNESSKDKEELATLQAQLAETAPNGGHNHSGANIDPIVNDRMATHVKALLAEVASLETTVRHLQWENKELTVPIAETRFTAANRAWLDPAYLRTHRSKQPESRVAHGDSFDALLDISQSLSMKPVRLKSTWPKDDKWRSVKNTTKWQVLRQKEELEMWDSHKGFASDGFVIKV